MSSFEAIFLDVGQGDSTLIALPNGEYVVVDVCRAEGHGTVDTFKVLRDVLPQGSSGKPRLDYLIITHAHDDHIWGIGDLAEEFEIGEIWVPQYGTKKELSKNYEAFEKVVESQSDDSKAWQKGSRSPVAELGGSGEVSVRCFSPPGYVEVEEALSEEDARRVVHENCGVYRLTFQGVSLLLAGDSNLQAWERIVGYYEDRADENDLSVLKSQVLHASHHGSRTFVMDDKGDDPWLDALDAIDPEAVVISVGENNRHGHPHDEMVDIYDDEVGSENVMQTKDLGTIVLTVTGEGTYELGPDESYAQRYGWDDEGGGKKGSGPSGGTPPRSRQLPPEPPPGYEKTPQRPARRERYGA